MNTSHTASASIPQTMQTFVRELAALARKRGIREISGEFKAPHDAAWSAAIAFSWRRGRHDEDAYQVVLTSTHTEYVRDVLSDEDVTHG
jgi:hypothetical protein